jgi:hypothetical protein
MVSLLATKPALTLKAILNCTQPGNKSGFVYHESGQTIKILAIDKREGLEVYPIAWKIN